MEGATRHPLQSYADLVTIEEFKTKERPKVVLTWAPHPRALPQAVANSFVEWMRETDYDLVVTHPEGYELAPEFMGDTEGGIRPEKSFEMPILSMPKTGRRIPVTDKFFQKI
jgi:N-succinyl-L-ornithine transcarbamylase